MIRHRQATTPAKHTQTAWQSNPGRCQIDGLVDKVGATGAFDDIMQQMGSRKKRINAFPPASRRGPMVCLGTGSNWPTLLNNGRRSVRCEYVSFETALRPDEMPGVAV